MGFVQAISVPRRRPADRRAHPGRRPRDGRAARPRSADRHRLRLVGALAALRTGSTEAVHSLFPVFFVFLFISSMNLPRNLIETDWFQTAATLNPVSYLIEAIRSLVIQAGRAGARAGLRHRDRPLDRRRHALLALAADKAGEDMRSVVSVALAVGWRMLHNNFTTPSLLIPGLAFPLFFFVAFAGGLSRVNDVPGFRVPRRAIRRSSSSSYSSNSGFAGVFTGFGIVRDFETGFAGA